MTYTIGFKAQQTKRSNLVCPSLFSVGRQALVYHFDLIISVSYPAGSSSRIREQRASITVRHDSALCFSSMRLSPSSQPLHLLRFLASVSFLLCLPPRISPFSLLLLSPFALKNRVCHFPGLAQVPPMWPWASCFISWSLFSLWCNLGIIIAVTNIQVRFIYGYKILSTDLNKHSEKGD